MIAVSFAELLFVYFAFVVIKRRLGDNCAIIAVNTRDVMSFSLIHDSSTQDFNAIKVGIVKIQLKKKCKPRKFLSYYVIWKYKPARSQTKSHQFNSPNFLTAFYDKFHLN